MASEQHGLRHELQGLTYGHISLGLMQNQAASTSGTPRTKNDWDFLFQSLFDEYFKSPSDVSTSIFAATLPPPDTTEASCSTSIDQDAPSPRSASTKRKLGSLGPDCVVFSCYTKAHISSLLERNNRAFKQVKKSPEDIRDIIMVTVHLKLLNFRFKDISMVIPFTQKTNSAESSSRIVDTSNMYTFQQPHIKTKRWTKDHQLETIVGNLTKPVSTRRQLATDALWWYFYAFLIKVELKNYEKAMKESC
nr:integrase, catalytic region, zinc finger, CCHC-type, peptidase aspartic, catalytic [Tanacetum cinerariifolium]